MYSTPSNSNVTLSAVMALWLGISIADSFKLLTYAIRSMNGISIANPGSKTRLYLPILSTIQAVCCGTKRTMVLAGKEGRWKYEDGGVEALEPMFPNPVASRGKLVDRDLRGDRKVEMVLDAIAPPRVEDNSFVDVNVVECNVRCCIALVDRPTISTVSSIMGYV